VITQIPPCPSQTADATGAATFTFGAPATGETWTGSLTIPTAPATAKFTAYAGSANGSPRGSWVGQNTARDVQTTVGQPLIVTATGLIPGTSYSCNWTGQVTTNDPSITQSDTQNPNVSMVTEQIALGGPAPYSGATVVTVTGVASWRSLWVAVKESFLSAAPLPTLVGVQSGLAYQAFEPPYFTLLTEGFFRFPLIDGLDTSYTLTVDAGGGGTGTYWYGADLADVDTAIYPESNSTSPGVNVAVPGAFPVTTTRQGTGADLTTIPLDVAPMGGLSSLSGTISSTTLTLILAAPIAGTAYRLHSFCATTTTQTLELVGTGQPFCAVTAPGFALLGGRVITSSISIKASGASTMAYELGYDLVLLPTFD